MSVECHVIMEEGTELMKVCIRIIQIPHSYTTQYLVGMKWLPLGGPKIRGGK
jgi:hypothetical protein